MLEAIDASDSSQYFIFSGGGINYLKPRAVEHFNFSLKKYFSQISVIAYIRAPWSFMVSEFQQRLKHSIISFDPENSYPHYKDSLKKFEDYFGRENIHYRFFNPSSFKGEMCSSIFLFTL